MGGLFSRGTNYETKSRILVSKNTSKFVTKESENGVDNNSEISFADFRNIRNIPTNNEIIRTQSISKIYNPKNTSKSVTKKIEYDVDNNSEMPFGDFRNIRIIPTKNELIETNEFRIRSNIDKGAFLSINHYLDIHFRLLREDFMAPLRDGIRNYLDIRYNKNLNSDIRIWDVKVASRTHVEQNRLFFVVKFNLEKNKLDALKNSKALCYGSLVIITKDSFQTIIVGSVSQKDELISSIGGIFVEPLNSTNIDEYVNEDVVMIEPIAYFESYRHVLEALQQINKYAFPMSKYIVKAEATSKLPGYLTKEKCDDILYNLLDFKTLGLNRYCTNHCIKYDETQYNAIKAALTNEFCIIQGPPGTGKTFIGLEIIKILLQNNTLWFQNGPILIVCKTNHALDQFLEGILKLTARLARVGGQSKNEKLNEFNIKELRIKFKKQKSNYGSYELKNITKEINDLHISCANYYHKGFACVDSMMFLKNQYNNILQNRDIEILREYLVVGMTTTGAAKNRRLLQGLNSPIVFVEEAAEVLESHIITSLTPACKHLILIGDHKQLRPSTADYRLAKHFKLDISLFERMIRNGMYCATLGVQHRMRPDFAELIVPSIYLKLKNHQSVYLYPSILGLTKNLFFIKHTHLEDVANSVSKQNKHEAKFLLQLCRYLILQGYTAKDVTILSTYDGQVHHMKNLQKSIPIIHDVRITSVDNFQGEECNIILLSLVRSNKKGQIGFLKSENRICVALSRAKHGFYIIGNMNILVKHTNSKWPEINQVLIKNESIGTDLVLQCQIHEDQQTKVNCGENFIEKSFEGGCLLPCNSIMPCGHRCERICHVQDREHNKIKCGPCLRVLIEFRKKLEEIIELHLE